MKKTLCIILAAMMICSAAAGCSQGSSTTSTTTAANTTASRSGEQTVEADYTIVLSGTSASLNGKAVEEFDYVWHANPSEVHDEVKDCPAEYYTGTAPDTDDAVYIAHDIYYMPAVDVSGFSKENYDGEAEWVYRYTAQGYEQYIFMTLPVLGTELPENMLHTEQEAYANPVLHITKAGTYVLSGEWNGQILIDLGDDAFSDESQKVTIILNVVTVTCTVAPAFIAYRAYECDNAWEEKTAWSSTVDTSGAGVEIVISDGSVNSFTGSNVFRMLKAKYKSGESGAQKKARKTDGAFYSYVSMNVNGGERGTGVLNITSSTFEGLDSELHLTVNGGVINIYSQDDGINVNEDDVSVFTINGGTLSIFAGLGAEGDGIDSNGYIIINGGTLYAVASPASDNGLDSDRGTEINGGTVVAMGSNMGGSTFSLYIDGQMQYADRQGGQGGFPGGQGGFPGGPGGQTPPDWQGGQTPPDGQGGQTPPDWQGGQQPPTPPDGQGGQTPPDGQGQNPPDGQ